MAEELRAQVDLLEDFADEINDDRIDERIVAGRDLLNEFDKRGTTIGAKQIGGNRIVEIPVATFSPVESFDEVILFTLCEHGEFASISEFAETLARELGEAYTDLFRSKVLYHVDRLGPGEKGYIKQDEQGGSYQIRLSRLGELWVGIHADRNTNG